MRDVQALSLLIKRILGSGRPAKYLSCLNAKISLAMSCILPEPGKIGNGSMCQLRSGIECPDRSLQKHGLETFHTWYLFFLLATDGFVELCGVKAEQAREVLVFKSTSSHLHVILKRFSLGLKEQRFVYFNRRRFLSADNPYFHQVNNKKMRKSSEYHVVNFSRKLFQTLQQEPLLWCFLWMRSLVHSSPAQSHHLEQVNPFNEE